ncbi:MAG: hypothetical protein M1825_002218 [Sarcosagium campestre]|nr:MAG: hypothetical protein M1825_002218 [Sarcosagium campestre]
MRLSTLSLPLAALALRCVIAAPISGMGGLIPFVGENYKDTAVPAYKSFSPLRFSLLSPLSYACFKGKSSDYCLPTGKFTILDSIYGFDFTAVKALGMPSGSAVEFFTGAGASVGKFSSNAPEDSNSDLRKAVQAVTGGKGKGDGDKPDALPYVTVTLSVDPLCVCLHEDVNLGGATACLGSGEDVLPSPIRNNVRSVSIHGQASMYAFFEAHPGAPYEFNVPDGKYSGFTEDQKDLGDLKDQIAGLKVASQMGGGTAGKDSPANPAAS